ncbi:hypothetical protein SAMN04244560_02309 [Thermoanaerobacter thermohydrosulfuricus]|uniref:Coenzyme PQQ synthesis protein D (PqqD) n=2 Tax=Thermoanaerobacter thermohydrosulfuricus TaxID=1516 RepID=M8DN66_THETY|nr:MULTISPECIES: hypothetical protein [Thermoanaerobacter]EMT38011.1 hypothetical protein TthWC1_2494 [Thermoanaerobacter thermohydrosulfuricus WC1]SDG41412.1 hypothetical protein SAMN04244560_02309 [Thermoanaerobacter thermohydrosulfuricus]SFE68184.1 hypothetical protein SAMN04324257_02516 [Thermoanaerobacter thermohydrosulfuricus]
MEYQIKKDVFIRHEKDLPGENVFIFVGSTEQMYQASKEVYEVIEGIKKGMTIEEIVTELSKVYTNSSEQEIFSGVQEVIKFLIEAGVVETK